LTIDTQAIAKFLKSMKKTYERMAYSEFNDGVRSGLQLTEQFIRTYENKEGNRIAKKMGGE
jgi:hypothetical protein